MTMRNLLEQEELPQQPVPITRVCWDDLFAFLKSWFAKAVVIHSPIIQFKRYSGISAQYQELINWKVHAEKGKLKGLGIACDNYTPLKLYIRIGDKELNDVQIQTPYNLPFDDLILRPTNDQSSQVIVKAKSDGATAIVVDASLVGYEVH
ncbi:hypothetical protein ES705_28343 [subsurface metagenome]